MSRFAKAALLLFALAMLAACAPRRDIPGGAGMPDWMGVPQDLRDFPQDLEVYARQSGKDIRLLEPAAQSAMDASFNRIFFGPWHMNRTSIHKGGISGFFKKARGYKDGFAQWSQAEWNRMRDNANLSSFPSRNVPAITLRNTDLREMPTHEPRFSEPTPDVRANPFDYFQYSLLPPGTPLLIAHTTLDGRWHFVECPVAGGWVDAQDVALVDASFQSKWEKGEYAALIRDKVALAGTGRNGGDSVAGIGTVLPLVARNADGGLNVLLPVAGSGGFARMAEIRLAAADAGIKPLPLTPGWIAKIGNVMMGQPYGWGCMLGERDCSALTRDIFTPFGIWLPRNSRSQARRGSVISLSGMTAQEKAAVILENGIPFLSLVGMKGHITLYLGAWKGKPAIFHNVWGLRVVKDGDDDKRFVIGRAVVTSITPGMELENLYRPVTFVDRLRTLTNLGAR